MLNPPSPAGSLQVNISPAGAITAGAQWSVDGGIPQPSAATVVGLSVGNHTLSFSTISGWTTPSNQTVSISPNATAIASGTYMLPAPLTVSGTPATFTDVFPAASPPIPGPNDIYQTNIQGEISSSSGINYYTDAASAYSGGLMCGTTFVTGSNAGGYVVTNVFVTSLSNPTPDSAGGNASGTIPTTSIPPT